MAFPLSALIFYYLLPKIIVIFYFPLKKKKNSWIDTEGAIESSNASFCICIQLTVARTFLSMISQEFRIVNNIKIYKKVRGIQSFKSQPYARADLSNLTIWLTIKLLFSCYFCVLLFR